MEEWRYGALEACCGRADVEIGLEVWISEVALQCSDVEIWNSRNAL